MRTVPRIRLIALLVATGMATSVLAGPPGKEGIPDHPKEPIPAQNIECTPRPGTESMDHDPKDHPMPKTRVMKNMDPAMHMQDCVDPDAPTAPDKVHDHARQKKAG